MAEVLSFSEFAEDQSGHGVELQYAVGIEGISGGDDSKVDVELAAANSAISYWFHVDHLKYGAPEAAFISPGGNTTNGDPWLGGSLRHVASVVFSGGSDVPAEIQTAADNNHAALEKENISIVAYSLVPESSQVNLHAVYTCKTYGKYKCEIRPTKIAMNVVTLLVTNAGMIEVQGSKPDPSKPGQVTPDKFYNSEKTNPGFADFKLMAKK